ncbi:MAG: ADP-ribosylglycohydrolase family protein [Ktedonobacteraceae bacterium]
MSTPHDHARLWRALISLDGLSIGDAFGERFFLFTVTGVQRCLDLRVLPEAKRSIWLFTDDTQTALSLVEILRRWGSIEQDMLAESFVAHYDATRAYGPNMHKLLCALRDGQENWRELTPAQFDGQGSYGNGAAMRVAPLGAYFADDLPRVVEQARLSAEVTHSHPEGIAGAIAVAVAAALAWQARQAHERPGRAEFIERVLPLVPTSTVQRKLQRARDIAPHTPTETAASMLGSGYQISAQDTVPFVLWCAVQYLDNYEEALWQTASGLGDIDTTCAMVGGIVSLYTGVEQIPEQWSERREALPTWALEG